MAKKLSLLHQDAIPYLYYKDAAAAIEFLSKAFGFAVRNIHKDDTGGVIHGELGVGASAVMVGPARDGSGFRSPSELPARHSGVWCYVDDSDAHCAKARAAGATIVREPMDQLYGVREYTARDVESHEWFFSTPLPGRAVATPRKKPAAKKARLATAAARPKQKGAKKK